MLNLIHATKQLINMTKRVKNQSFYLQYVDGCLHLSSEIQEQKFSSDHDLQEKGFDYSWNNRVA